MSRNVINAVLCAVVVATFTGLVAQPLVASESLNADEWMIELVDRGQTRVAQHNSIALDSDGFPHISYEDNDGSAIKYARWNGSVWTTEFVDNSSDGINSIDVDSKDNPHIVHTTPNLRYAWWNGTEWNVSTLDNSAVLGFIEIVIDDQDNPHIAYRHDQYQLRYLYWDGGKWVSEIVSSHVIGLAASLALDDNGLPHLAFFSDSRIAYASRDGQNWSIEVVDATTRVGSDSCTSIAIDSDGFPHISYKALLAENLMYARWNGTEWLIETLDTDLAGHISSLALGKDDYPRISYRGAFHLKFAEWTGSEWDIEVVDRMRIGTSLALDDRDNPHISYHRSQSLYYATKTKPLPARELELEVYPETLNLKSRGRWLTAQLIGENAEDIDASSLLLNDMISPLYWYLQNETTLIAKFSRSAVQTIVPISDEVTITVTGRWKDGEIFENEDFIRVIGPGNYLDVPDSFSSLEWASSFFMEDSRMIPHTWKPMKVSISKPAPECPITVTERIRYSEQYLYE